LGNPAAVSAEWQQYFAKLHGISLPPVFQASAWTEPPAPVPQAAATREQLQESVDELINAYRLRGHLFANLDPLGLLQPPPTAEMELVTFGLSDGDLDKTFSAFGTELTLREIVERCRRTYCRTIGVEFMHGEDPAIKQWLQQKMESTGNMATLSREQKLRILARLTDAETIETFLHRKYIGKKRFSLEGGESLIPLLDWLIDEFGKLGGEEIVLGMAHRGRLNVLVNVLGKGLNELFAEFEDSESEIEKMLGRGDVKYHLGYSSDRGKMHLSLAFNPSHLEIVNPVVEGRVRAKQDRTLNWEGAPNPRDPERRKVLPVLIHGDAAFAGQGIVAEVLNLANLEGYATGGTVHVIVNNQVGFTTNPEDARSTPYCTDIARVLRAPVFHVNGEDPEAVVWAVQLAVEYRQTFQQDVLIDLYCYRKYGHNEGDEPAFTQPRMYEVIRSKQPPREVYAHRLAEEGVATDGEADTLMRRRVETLEAELERTRKEGAKRASISAMAGLWNHYRGGPDAETPEVATQVPEPKLRELLAKLSQVPASFTPNDKVARLLEQRRKIAGGPSGDPFDWGIGEHLAFATLLDEGAPIRFSGQDARRGTFSHRHAVLADARDGKRYTPLAHLREGQGRFDIFDSALSEAGVMGFDYGWSLDMPEALCCWEAQFGDFANGAQVVIDQFISSAEDKWNRLCGMVLLLPHGFEGQGPEHSSARLERYLQLCAEDNMQVCYPTTPAQIFHLLRRQVLRPWRKPLVVLTPKSLLRHKHAVSTLDDLSRGAFRRIIWDHEVPRGAKRVLLCTGKVYYDLLAGREEKKRSDVAIVRLEQLYPLTDAQLAEALKPHAGAEVVWVQEEPFNMGAWYYLRARWPAALGKISCVSRPESASPATGSEKSHKFEQHLLVDQAFGDAPMRKY
ncbi:MAG TPA: 2-oxoglutarate dehydrogenase E1 component, partial [Myxococcales bacterium]|nr:2-oxoglutarate dehydrogenase E1 component [Myxococcales bacterium]